MKKEEFEDYLDSLLTFYELNEEDKESVDWILEALADVNPGNIMETLELSLEGWQSHLDSFESQEEYEICGKIKQIMAIEMIETGELITRDGDVDEEQVLIFFNLKYKYKI